MPTQSAEGQDVTTYLLNLLDLFFTLIALSMRVRELNPLLQSVPFMIFYKVFVVGIACYLLRGKKILRFTSALYAVVDLWHIYNLILIS
jgi:hypothetical protein